MKPTVCQLHDLRMIPVLSTFFCTVIYCISICSTFALAVFCDKSTADDELFRQKVSKGDVLASAPIITIGVDHHFPPWIFADGSGTQQVIINALFNNLGYQVEFLLTPRERGAFLTDSGQINGFIHDEAHADAKNAFLIPIAIAELEVIAFTISNINSITSVCDLANYNLGFLQGCNECLRLIENCPQRGADSVLAKSIAYPSRLEDLFRMLVNGRIDVAITNKRGGYFTIQQMNLKNIQINTAVSRPSKNYLFLHSKHHSLLEPLTTEMIKFKSSDSYRSYFKPRNRS